MTATNSVIIRGSAPDAARAADWPRPADCRIVAINNAWRIREDWDYLVFPEDFPEDRRPVDCSAGQQTIEADDFVPANNQFGGIVYAGGTMAFTAGYWALAALKPRVLAYLGCDMVYSDAKTHFYGEGTADPLREDVTLASLEAKSARLMAIAASQGCACVNLSTKPESRLVFPRAAHTELNGELPVARTSDYLFDKALRAEKDLGYFVESGIYWEHPA
ncbi:MAG: hypothetical protein ACR2OJ_08875, partial [Hyphomicrobiales bacterium]